MQSGGIRLTGIKKHSQIGMPLITVITVVYNDEKMLEKTILSIIEQTYNNIEYIIVDGGSTDATLDIIKKYEHKIDYWVSEPDKGVYYAMNKGIDFSTGEWFNFMNSGDRFYNNFVVEKIFNNNTDHNDIIYGNTIFTANGIEALIYPNFNDIIERLPFRHQSCFIKSLPMRHYKYDISYKLAADYNLIYHLYLNNIKFEYVNMIISVCSGDTGYTAMYPMLGFKERLIVRGENVYSLRNILILSYLGVRQIIKNMLPRKFTVFIMGKTFKKRAKNKGCQ